MAHGSGNPGCGAFIGLIISIHLNNEGTLGNVFVGGGPSGGLFLSLMKSV